MPIQVTSEIMPLKRVLLHRPGCELEHLVPASLEQLLFDDIPYLRGAQAEHDQFADVLRSNGVEVVYLSDLTAETLSQSPALRSRFVDEFIRESGGIAGSYAEELRRYLLGLPDERTMVLKTMAGVAFEELGARREGSLPGLLQGRAHFVLDPIPNLYFTRDPFASIGSGVALHHMYSATRNRETIYGRYVLQYHPDYAGTVPFYYTPEEPFSLEGGDILNLSRQVLAVGISQRTMPEAVERLAERIFTDPNAEIRTILALYIPSVRAFMHLDTVMTQVDADKFVIHPGILGSLRIFEVCPAAGGRTRARLLSGSLDEILAHYLNLPKVTLIRCGGYDRIASQREQWNDGSNTLCIAPGTVIAYDRNYVTNQILEESGVRVLRIPSGELSRGRGGPRCMSMPLLRAEGAGQRK